MEGQEEQLLFFKGGTEGWNQQHVHQYDEEEEFDAGGDEDYDGDEGDEIDDSLVEHPTQLHFAFPQEHATYSMYLYNSNPHKNSLKFKY